MKKISVLLIDDSELLREGMTALINAQPDMMVPAALETGEGIEAILQKLRPDIVLLDAGLSSASGTELAADIKKISPVTGIILMGIIAPHSDLVEFIEAGVSGFTLKDTSMIDFFNSIRRVHSGEKVLPQLLTGSLFTGIFENAIKEGPVDKITQAIIMTAREKEIITLISEGHSNKTIAEKLYLSPSTVKSHVHNILEKLSLHSRLQVARYARDNS